ncbi:hypothetical protein H6F86_24615 [Phormidium sp. FACHB-592]|uniref:Uncharacterized protein n=1 Tax=Stenomitos frigidus AS-A4 TaxID=2933935 RepID=A0ABV0KN71_9CYAN|nr:MULTISPECIES: hypothetical protein [Cyanophyceae]MBD2036075.1 hypothetical protein [Leptolyngbya sp. FACHB-321]MBD2077011.1 hypothetical protein [Phormidium sp. FACHB-592]
MTRLRPPLSVILPASIVAVTLLFGSSIATQACPLADGKAGLSQMLRQPDVSDRSASASLPETSNRQPLDYVDVVGLSGIMGLFAIALSFKVRRSHAIEPTEAEFLNRFPQIEHPELALTSVPQEALPSHIDRELVSVR